MNLQAIIDAPSVAKDKAKAMGFDYQGASVRLDGSHLVITGRFRCVCDKLESFDFRIDLSALDPAALLEAHGAFSREHLEEDGYSEEEIVRILNAGSAYLAKEAA